MTLHLREVFPEIDFLKRPVSVESPKERGSLCLADVNYPLIGGNYASCFLFGRGPVQPFQDKHTCFGLRQPQQEQRSARHHCVSSDHYPPSLADRLKPLAIISRSAEMIIVEFYHDALIFN